MSELNHEIDRDNLNKDVPQEGQPSRPNGKPPVVREPRRPDEAPLKAGGTLTRTLAMSFWKAKDEDHSKPRAPHDFNNFNPRAE
jgi:hypothetical protein